MSCGLKCRHEWIFLALEENNGELKSEWRWCKLCGATKCFIYDASYFGLDDNGIYIRHPGKDKEFALIEKWRKRRKK